MNLRQEYIFIKDKNEAVFNTKIDILNVLRTKIEMCLRQEWKYI